MSVPPETPQASPTDTHADGAPHPLPRSHVWRGAAVVLAAVGLLSRADLWRPDCVFDGRRNVQIAEAQSWWHGRLDLPERPWDTALLNGRVYSYFPPMFTLVAAVFVPWFAGVPHWAVVALSALVPLLAYRLFLDRTRSVTWAMGLAFGFVCGTSAWPVTDLTIRSAAPYHVNHVLSTIGVLLIVMEFLGRRRLWPQFIGLALTTLSRQLTVGFALAPLATAWWSGPRERRWLRLAGACAACGLPLAAYAALNTLKFGHPFQTGYMLNHEGRDDVFAREARAHGLLSWHWVPRNLYYSNLGPPDGHVIHSDGRREVYLHPNNMGTGIWWTTPLLIWLFVEFRSICRDRWRAVLLLSVAMVYGLSTFWHATGAVQRGYNRYSLDYLPALLALLVPACLAGWRRWVSLAMIAWSVVYFCVLLPKPHIQVWGW